MALALSSLAAAAAADCITDPNPSYPCSVPCYCAPAWGADAVVVTENITYSEKYGLVLDLYEPPAADARARRPAMVAIHGGGFVGGDRREAGVVEWCRRLAATGYVCASIEYRFSDPVMFNKATETVSNDARAAVRWLRRYAAERRVDAARIGAFGSSAGAMTTAWMVAVPGEGDSGNDGFPSNISVGVSFSGALVKDRYKYLRADQPPYLDFHGCDDSVCPYNDGGISSIAESAVSTHRQMDAAGAVNGLISLAGQGHVPMPAIDAHSTDMLGFLAQHLTLAGAECPVPP